MKILLMAIGFAAANVMACPNDGAKDAMAPSSDKPAAVAKAKPTNSTAAASTKTVTKVAVKPAAAPRKSTTL